METLVGLGTIFWVVVICFSVGSFLALPLIWYHIGHVSRKLSKLAGLQRETNAKLARILESLSDKDPGAGGQK